MNLTTFPNFFFDGYFWTTYANLPAWTGFQVRNGPYGAISSDEKSSGIHKIVFAPEGRDGQELNDGERSLVQWVVDHEKAIHDEVIALLFKLYPAIQTTYLEAYGEDGNDILPDISELNEIKSIVGIVTIHVHQVSKNGIPYIGIELGCDWDEEHGAGILLHGSTPLEVGGADTAFLLWMARKYADES